MIILLTLFLACFHAVDPVDNYLVGNRLVVEQPENWKVTRNYRWFGSHFIVLSNKPAILSIELIRVGSRGYDIPLDLVAEGISMETGRKRGIFSKAIHSYEIVLANRRAIALTGYRQHGPIEVDFTTIVSRADKTHLIIITLHTPKNELDFYGSDLERIINTLELPQQPNY